MAEIEYFINTFDDKGEVIGSRSVVLTKDQVEDVVSHAIQLMIVQRNGQNVGEVYANLEEALEVYDLLPQQT